MTWKSDSFTLKMFTLQICSDLVYLPGMFAVPGGILTQQNLDLAPAFYQTWATMKAEFGNITIDFWLGYDCLKALSSTGLYKLH